MRRRATNSTRERYAGSREDGSGFPQAGGGVLASSAMVVARAPVEVSITPERMLYGLLAVIGMLVVGATLDTIASLQFGFEFGRSTIRRHFVLSAENNIPTYFSALQLLVAAVLLGVNARHQALIRSPWRWHFLVLAVGFAFLSVDEVASIHETALGRLGGFLLGRTFEWTWLGPGIVIVLLVGLSYLRFLLALPRRFGALFVASGAVFVAGAVGAEWIGSEIFRRWGFNWAYQIEVIIEEGLEMVGIALFIYALLLYVAETRIGLVVRVRS
jgi:hypothetical protein